MATVSARHAGDDIVAKETALFITSADLPANTDTGYDDDNYPASPAVTYYFSIEKTGQDSLVSQVFTPSADDGVGEWNDVIIPATGTWTLHARKTADDSSVANTTLTVV
jgi:hypothetical protein